MQHKHIHHLLNDIIFNVETHPRKTTNELFIWHEKYMAPFVCALIYRLYSISSSLIYTELSFLSFSIFFYHSIFSYLIYYQSTHILNRLLFSLTLLLIHTQLGSTALLIDIIVYLGIKQLNNK